MIHKFGNLSFCSPHTQATAYYNYVSNLKFIKIHGEKLSYQRIRNVLRFLVEEFIVSNNRLKKLQRNCRMRMTTHATSNQLSNIIFHMHYTRLFYSSTIVLDYFYHCKMSKTIETYAITTLPTFLD